MTFGRLRGGCVTVICLVVSAASVPDLSEQFTPAETAPAALVSLIQAIEQRGRSDIRVRHPSESPVRLAVFP